MQTSRGTGRPERTSSMGEWAAGSAIGAPPVARPLLRGYSHALAAIVAALGTGVLLRLTADDPPKQLSLFVYGITSVLLFTVSALYHLGPWTPRQRVRLCQLDRAAIFVVMAGGYTPAAFNLLTGWWRIGLLGLAWALAGLGVALVAPAHHLPRRLVVAVYVAMGWAAVVILPEVMATLGVAAIRLPLLAGGLYTVGAVMYALRWPPLWPRVFGYHELFHLAVIVASALVFAFMLQEVVPFPRH